MALRVGPLVYNIEQVDQDITGVLPAVGAARRPSGAPDLLGGVNVDHGHVRRRRADDRDPELRALQPQPAGPAAGAARAAPAGRRRRRRSQPAPRPAPPPPTSIVWIREK